MYSFQKLYNIFIVAVKSNLNYYIHPHAQIIYPIANARKTMLITRRRASHTSLHNARM